jgi:hypothetical protein
MVVKLWSYLRHLLSIKRLSLCCSSSHFMWKCVVLLKYCNLLYLEQGPDGNKSSLPPLYTQPDCEDIVKNFLYRLEDCVRTGKYGCILTSYFSEKLGCYSQYIDRLWWAGILVKNCLISTVPSSALRLFPREGDFGVKWPGHEAWSRKRGSIHLK